jgi:hypothetical protein
MVYTTVFVACLVFSILVVWPLFRTTMCQCWNFVGYLVWFLIWVFLIWVDFFLFPFVALVFRLYPRLYLQYSHPCLRSSPFVVFSLPLISSTNLNGAHLGQFLLTTSLQKGLCFVVSFLPSCLFLYVSWYCKRFLPRTLSNLATHCSLLWIRANDSSIFCWVHLCYLAVSMPHEHLI